ncbi:MAG: SWIM zinc finger family protein, partial [bacterium]
VDSARIDRGINYADHEMVGELQFHFSSVKAEVGGSSYNNYNVEIELPRFKKDEISKISTILKKKFTPQKTLEEIKKSGVDIVPAIFDNISLDCNCLDDNYVCKHIVAVFHELAERIEQEPLLLLELRGININNKNDIFDKYLDAANEAILKRLVKNLIKKSKENYHEVLDFLQDNIELDNESEQNFASEKIMSLWKEIKRDVKGTSYYEDEEYAYVKVCDILYKMEQEFERGNVPKGTKRKLIQEVIKILSDEEDAYFVDELLSTLLATCEDKEDYNYLAEKIENIEGYYKKYAIDLYRKAGNKEKYLELRLKALEYGCDYYDLVTFYEENNEEGKAVKLAYEALEKCHYKVNDLLDYLAEKALKSGNREEYLRLKFQKLFSDRINLENYRAFENICNKTEWTKYEEKVLKEVEKTCHGDRINIFMYREDFENVIKILAKINFSNYIDSAEFKAAEKLKVKYPKDILKFYLTVIGDLTTAKDREFYTRQAKIAVKIQDIYINILKDEDSWNLYIKDIKDKNKNKKALQDEFSKKIKNWMKY